MQEKVKTVQSTHVVRTPQELAALASPMRQELVGAVSALQPCTIAQLGEHLGRLPVSLYYHLRKLESVGLVLEASRQATDGAEETLYRLRSKRLRLDPDRSKPRNRLALRKIGAALLRHALRLNDDAVEEPLAREPKRRKHQLFQRTLRLDAGGLKQVNAKFAELVDLLDEVGLDADVDSPSEFFTMTVALAPNPARLTEAPD